MQSQNHPYFQWFLTFQWEKPIEILLKTGLEWEEKYLCTQAVNK